MHPQSPQLIFGGTVLKESNDLVILGVTFDSKGSRPVCDFKCNFVAATALQLIP